MIQLKPPRAQATAQDEPPHAGPREILLEVNGVRDPVRQAFVAYDAMQCGMVMSSGALVEANPHPSAGDVKAAVAGHLCRCGPKPHAIDAVRDVARAGKGARG